MKYTVDEKYIIDTFRRLVETPSPVGFDTLINPVIEQLAEELGEKITYDNRGTAYMTLEGEDNTKTVLISSHWDTIGMVVRTVDPNGMIRVRSLGGTNLNSAEGESVTVHTRDGRIYTGLIACQSHSVHVFDNARTLERNDNTMVVLLDEDVHSKKDVRDLGILNGDYISVEPRCEYTKNGLKFTAFIKK